jgi:outer membrane protein TolC
MSAVSSVRRGARALAALLATLPAGCAIYHAKPLPATATLTRSPALEVPARTLAIPGLGRQSFDPALGFTATNIVTLAVVDDPALAAARARAGVARAQLLEARLLPDPQLTGGWSRSSLRTGYEALLGEDLRALVTRGALEGAAAAHLQQVNLAILWQEWQVAERARQLYIEAEALARLKRVLARRRRLLGKLYREDVTSLERREVTVASVAADFAAWDAAESEWRSLELDSSRNRHQLDALLGLEPSVRLKLRATPAPRPMSAAQYRSALATIARRRPDLLALRAGYRSQEERLRAAILAQFPLVNAGIDKARSAEEGVQTLGVHVSLTLPLFNRNRGAIAIERATRAALYRAYRARLDQSVGETDQVFEATRIMRGELAALERRVSEQRRLARAAAGELERGTASLDDYARIDSEALALETQAIQLRAAMQQAQAALAILLALPP